MNAVKWFETVVLLSSLQNAVITTVWNRSQNHHIFHVAVC